MGKVTKVAVAWTGLTAVWVLYVLITFSNTESALGIDVTTNRQSNALRAAVIIYVIGMIVLGVVKWVASDKKSKEESKAAATNN